MGRSFFNGTDGQLYTGSKAFATKILATPTAYGLTEAQATAYAALDAVYAAAYVAAIDPETRTKAKVRAKNDAKVPLKIMASDLAKIIDGTATVTNEQKIDLGLSVRDTPSPMGDPGVCTDFRVTLNGDGTLLFKWKCKNPVGAHGTIYQIWRRIGGVGEFAYVGGAGQKEFLDATVPAGTTSLTYQIQAIRSTAAGPWVQFNVGFGQPSAGLSGAKLSVTTTDVSPRLAA